MLEGDVQVGQDFFLRHEGNDVVHMGVGIHIAVAPTRPIPPALRTNSCMRVLMGRPPQKSSLYFRSTP